VPTHVHEASTELLYIRAGTGVMTVGSLEYPVTAGMAVQIPPGVEHGFTATSEIDALQFYSPSGPEQRFKPEK
jgi:mannose-6-phosphate isomerase-like protein (cupin superfamily)